MLQEVFGRSNGNLASWYCLPVPVCPIPAVSLYQKNWNLGFGRAIVRLILYYIYTPYIILGHKCHDRARIMSLQKPTLYVVNGPTPITRYLQAKFQVIWMCACCFASCPKGMTSAMFRLLENENNPEERAHRLCKDENHEDNSCSGKPLETSKITNMKRPKQLILKYRQINFKHFAEEFGTTYELCRIVFKIMWRDHRKDCTKGLKFRLDTGLHPATLGQSSNEAGFASTRYYRRRILRYRYYVGPKE